MSKSKPPKIAAKQTSKPRELYTLTDEHRAQLKPWADRWIPVEGRTR